MPACETVKEPVDEQQDKSRREVRKQHLERVDKRRVTQNTRVGVEEPESHCLHTQYNQALPAERDRLHIVNLVRKEITADPDTHAKSDGTECQIE